MNGYLRESWYEVVEHLGLGEFQLRRLMALCDLEVEHGFVLPARWELLPPLYEVAYCAKRLAKHVQHGDEFNLRDAQSSLLAMLRRDPSLHT